MAKTATAKPRVYSYIRFSTPEQAIGDSERRQAELFAERAGLVLDESLKDRGLSGYHGTHRKKGALGRFLERVIDGDVPSGSILVVENIDRLSREGVAKSLRNIIFKLFDHEIILQTLEPMERYEAGCEEDPKFLALMLYLARAREESKRKSVLGKANWKHKRELARTTGKLITKKFPYWLTLDDKNHFKPIPEATRCIRQLFKWKLEGLGVLTIAHKLNQQGTWIPPLNKQRKERGWRSSYIRKILKDRAVIGELQPHVYIEGKRSPEGEPLAGYYPAVVTPTVFYAVQAQFEKNKRGGGRLGKVTNLFTKLVKCAYCGSPMHMNDKGRGQKLLTCDNARHGSGCYKSSIKYAELEKLILENCPKLRPERVLPSPAQNASLREDLSQRIAGIDAQLADIESRKLNFLDQMGRTNSAEIRDQIELQLRSLLGTAEELQTQRKVDAAALIETNRDAARLQEWQRDMKHLQDAIKGDASEIRQKLRAHLREFIQQVDCFTRGHCGKDGQPSGDDDWDDYIEAVFDEVRLPAARRKGLQGFVADVMQRRMSREGRFIRVRFVTGMTVDLVPPGSVASGLEMAEETPDKFVVETKGITWRTVLPDFNKLLTDFERRKVCRKKFSKKGVELVT